LLRGIRQFENKEFVASQRHHVAQLRQLNMFMGYTVLQSIISNGKANIVNCSL